MRCLVVVFVFGIVCQVNFSQGFQRIGGKYYHIEDYDKLDWHDARDKCRSMNAHLVSIQNSREYHAIRDYLQYCNSYWVDIVDVDSDFTFTSDTTGREAPFLRWASRQPSSKAEYDCVKLKAKSHHMKTKYCSQENYYICEAYSTPVTPKPVTSWLVTSAPVTSPPSGSYPVMDLSSRNY